MRIYVWMIEKKSVLNNSIDYLDNVYTSLRVAELICENEKKENEIYTPIETMGEIIHGVGIILKGRVYKISNLTVDDILNQNYQNYLNKRKI